MKLTDQQRAELKALADAATPGPWEVADTDSEGEYGSGDDTRSGFKTFGVCAGSLCIVDALNSDAAEVHEEFDGESLYAWDEVAKRNAAFIAAAREAVPALLADLEEAESERRKAQSSANEAWDQLRDAEDELAATRQQLAEAQALLASSGEPIEINPPDYHYEAMGCGLEDRGITDRYEAMQYGWDCAIDKFLEQTPEGTLYTAPPAVVIEQAVAPYKRDAERWKGIKQFYTAAVFDPEREDGLDLGPGVALIFMLPKGSAVSGNADATIDSVLSAKEKSNG